MQERAALARYSHLPIGNMGADWVLSTADALFARRLRNAGHLLWVSDPTLPDVAAQGDEGFSAAELLDHDQLSMEVRLNP